MYDSALKASRGEGMRLRERQRLLETVMVADAIRYDAQAPNSCLPVTPVYHGRRVRLPAVRCPWNSPKCHLDPARNVQGRLKKTCLLFPLHTAYRRLTHNRQYVWWTTGSTFGGKRGALGRAGGAATMDAEEKKNLHVAADKGNYEKVREILAADHTRVNEPDPDSWNRTPLHKAALRNHVDLARKSIASRSITPNGHLDIYDVSFGKKRCVGGCTKSRPGNPVRTAGLTAWSQPQPRLRTRGMCVIRAVCAMPCYLACAHTSPVCLYTCALVPSARDLFAQATSCRMGPTWMPPPMTPGPPCITRGSMATVRSAGC
jgi:hypothetical protein